MSEPVPTLLVTHDSGEGDEEMLVVRKADHDAAIDAERKRAEEAERTRDHERCERIQQHEDALGKVRDEARKVTESALRIKAERDALAATIERVKALPREQGWLNHDLIRVLNAALAAPAPRTEGGAASPNPSAAPDSWDGVERRDPNFGDHGRPFEWIRGEAVYARGPSLALHADGRKR